MKKILFIFLCVLFAIGTQAVAQSDYYFSKTYGYAGSNGLRQTIEVIEGQDTSYVSVGGNGDVVLMKTNAKGNLIWSKTYGGTSHDIGNSVKQATDGGYIVVGTTMSFTSGFTPCALLVIKTDSVGNVEGSQSYQGGNITTILYAEGYDVEVANDGYFLVGNISASSNLTSLSYSTSPPFILKLDLSGNLLWSKIYPYVPLGIISIKKTIDGGLVLASEHFELIKIDSVGTPLWNFVYSINNEGIYCNQMISTSDGGFLLVGKSENTTTNDVDVLVLKVNINGLLEWSKKIGTSTNYENSYGVTQDINHDYIFSGFSADGITNAIINFKVDSLGSLIWGKLIASPVPAYNYGYAVLPIEKGYLVCGNLNNSIGIIKLDTMGDSKCNSLPLAVLVVDAGAIKTTKQLAVIDVTNMLIINYPNLIVGSGLTETVVCETIFPMKDLKVEKILSPASSLPAGTNLYPSFRVKNIGTDTIYNFNFFYSYTGEITGTQIVPVTKFSVLENWNGTLLPNQQIDLTFNEPLSISAGFADFCTFVELVDDIDTSNNSLCITVEGTTIGIDQPTSNPPKIYPNPTSEYIFISGALGENFILFNSLGEIVLTQRISDEKTKIQLLLPKGIYLYYLGQYKGKIFKI